MASPRGRCRRCTRVARASASHSTVPSVKEPALAPSASATAGRDDNAPPSGDGGGGGFGLRAQFKNLGQLLGSHALVGIAGLASLPLLARNLGPEAYGRFSLFVMSLGVLAQLDVTRPLLTRRFARGEGRHGLGSDRVVAGTLTTVSSTALGLFGVGAGLFVGGPVTALALGLALLLHGLASPHYARLAAEGRVGVAGAIRNGAWTAALVSVVLVSSTTRTPHAWVWSFLAANAFILLLYRAVSRIPLSRRPDFAVLRSHARASWDVVGFAAASLLVATADRLLLESHTDEATFGRYAAQYDLATKVNILSTAIGSVLYPSLSRLFAERGADVAAAHFTRVASRVALGYFLLLGAAIALHRPILELVFGPEFTDVLGAEAYALMLVGVFLHLFGFLLTPYQRAAGDFRSQRRAYAVAGVAMLGFGLYAIPRFGVAGAVATYLVSRLAEVILLVVEARRMPAGLGAWRLILALATLTALLLALALYVTPWTHAGGPA